MVASSMTNARTGAAVLLAGLTLVGSAIAAPVSTTYSTVDLIAEQASLPADGGTVTLGFYLEPNPGWHAYWSNPGDAGLEPRMRWDLQEGFEAAPFEFPVPHVLPFIDLITYAYEEPLLLISDVTVPEGLAPGESVQLQGRASWVVCDDELCVPENTTLFLTLPVGEGDPDAAQADRFAAARGRLPEPVDWPAQFERLEGTVRVSIETPEAATDARDPYLFITERNLVEYGRQSISFTPRGAVVSMDSARRMTDATEFSALLTFTDNDGALQAFSFNVQEGAGVAAGVLGGSGGGLVPAAQSYSGLSFGVALLFAFIGGIVLNLMPCVFPILSMKALSLVKMSQTDRRVAAQSGLLYTAGILVAFAFIGGALVALREAGQAVGWGFQLQSPVVNLALGLLMLAIALNLFGVFEVGTRIMGVGQTLTAGGERRAAFFTGLLAVLVATPCTAPFMAGALGYALVQPAAVALSVFLALGFGLAFPYLLLSYVPAAGRVLPRPGPWMATFKHVLAFPMLATAVWLFWVIGKQLGVDSMTVGLMWLPSASPSRYGPMAAWRILAGPMHGAPRLSIGLIRRGNHRPANRGLPGSASRHCQEPMRRHPGATGTRELHPRARHRLHRRRRAALPLFHRRLVRKLQGQRTCRTGDRCRGRGLQPARHQGRRRRLDPRGSGDHRVARPLRARRRAPIPVFPHGIVPG